MQPSEMFFFVVLPYLCLAFFVLGHAWRYITDRFGWTARSSEFLEKKLLLPGTVLFHWGIILTFVGHAGGLLIPQRIYDAFGISAEGHLAIAFWSGLAVGLASFAGIVPLLYRRLTHPRVIAAGTRNDAFTLGALAFVVATGLYNVIFGHHNVLYTLAPWIRSIVMLSPDPALMREVPWSFKLHVVSALVLLGFSPFSRLVHIWSIPVSYAVRPWIVLRRKPVLPPAGK